MKSNASAFLDLISEYAPVKKPSLDILKDFEFILQYQLDRFGKVLEANDSVKIQNKMNVAKSLNKKSSHNFEHQNRLYLLTDIDIPELVLFDIQDCILEHLKYSFDILGTSDPYETPACYCNTLFIFEGKDKYVRDISAKHLSELLRCFHSENQLSNASIRNSWYGEPRRKERADH